MGTHLVTQANGTHQPIKVLGVGLAAGVLIDTFITRSLLVPSIVMLLGKWNWWLPKRLHWLPKIEHEPQAGPAAA